MLKIWGRKNSVNVQKVLWCCGELGIPFEREDIGGPFGGNDESWYLSMNPTGLVPTISEGDGFALWESNAIVRYLAVKYGEGTLWPEDLRMRAEADKWMDFQMGTVWAHLRTVFLGLVRTPPEERDEVLIEESRRMAEEAFAVFDGHLSGLPYVAGYSFTIGDIPLGVTAHRWFNLDIERAPMANLEAWYARLDERAAFRENVAALPLS